MIRKFVAAAVIAAVCVTSGCAPVHRTSRAVSDQSKTFATLPDKAVVYIYRRTLIGAAISANVKVDNIPVGATGAFTFFKLALPPGHHTIESSTEASTTLAIDVQAGQNYYIWQNVKFGILVFRTGLHLMTAEEGQAEVRKLKLLATSAPQFRMPDAPYQSAVAGTVVVPARTHADENRTAAPAAAMPTGSAATPDTASSPVTAGAQASEATSGYVTSAPTSDLAVLDPRIDKAMFVAAQDLASLHQCERLLHVRTVDGGNAHLFSACPGSSTPIEILCNGASCHEGAPQG